MVRNVVLNLSLVGVPCKKYYSLLLNFYYYSPLNDAYGIG